MACPPQTVWQLELKCQPLAESILLDTVLVLDTGLGMIDVGRRIGGRVSCVCQRKKSWGNHTVLALQGMSVGATRVRMGIVVSI